jgi:hypothetical protein
MPTSVTKRSPGKPAMICSARIPTDQVPIRKAMAKPSAPMPVGKAVAITNIATRPRMEAVCADISGRSGAGLPYQRPPGADLSSPPSPRRRARTARVELAAAGGFISASTAAERATWPVRTKASWFASIASRS